MHKSPIIIPGTTRGGTTAVTEALIASGVDMYDWAMPYSEDADVWAMNAIEAQTNAPKVQQFPHGFSPTEQFLSRLRAYKRRRLKAAKASGRPWGFKEPLIARMLQPYLELFPNAKWVFCVRNGLSCVWSQRKRGHMPWDDFQGLTRHTSYTFNFLTTLGLAGVVPCLLNYDGDVREEQEALSEYLELEVDLASTWKWSRQSRARVSDSQQNAALNGNDKGWM